MTNDSATRIRVRCSLHRDAFTLNVDLNLPGRGVTALYGQSGSGKTSLLRCIAGLERAADGLLSVNGAVWQDSSRGFFLPAHRRELGYVFQEASLFPHLSVRHNLQYGLKRIPESARRVSLTHAVDLLGIGHLLNRMPDELSGGERQRISIARALAVSPKLLLMDEPLSALDMKRKNEILPYLERLHDELEIPVFYVSHSPDEVARLADHVVLMEQGQVRADGALPDILSRLDLPLRMDEDAGVVWEGRVTAKDVGWHLAYVDVGGPGVWVRDGGVRLDQRLRVRILARDVSLALMPHAGSSILNALPATVVELGDDQHPALTLARLDVGGNALLARLTRRSSAALGLHPDQAVWAHIKSVALLG